MMISAIKSLMKRKYHGWNVYIHNISHFDGIFLLRLLTKVGNLNPTFKDGNIINLNLSWKNSNGKSVYDINFRDSLLLLPNSLRKLAKAFNVENKAFFPYRFVNDPSISLQYEGLIPNISFYDEVNVNSDQLLISGPITEKWNLRDETIKYCILDCVVLYQVLSKFNKLIYSKWNLNIHKYPTLSSLAFGIYKTHYMPEDTLPKLGGKIYDFIKAAYTGGKVDVHIPYGEDLYYYDFNSLYPSILAYNPVPIGNPIWFEGDCLKFIPDAFGFFKCNIETPNNIKHPILQTRIKVNGSYKTVAPLGKWTGVLFSEEVRFAISQGYKIEVLEGYTFEKANIFQNYVFDIYAIKKAHSPSDPMYLISKLLLNSLYGRFGMAPILNKHEVIDSNELDKYITNPKINIADVIDLNNGFNIVSFINKEDLDIDSDIANSDISIGIAASCTAYYRVALSYFLNSNDYNVYYHDTDSIITDKPLDKKFVGKELGQLKLEYKINKGVFLAPKVYNPSYRF
jgi:hypothetical protein